MNGNIAKQSRREQTRRRLMRIVMLVGVAVSAAAVLYACKPPPEVNLVVVGDSLSSGHQHGCTVHYQQKYSYAKQLADRAGWPMRLPLITDPGARPCMDIFETGNPLAIARVVNPTVTPECAANPDPNDEKCWGVRKNPGVVPTNLGTPGTRMVDVFSAPPNNGFHGLFGLDYVAMWKRFMDTPDSDPDQSMAERAVARILAHDDDHDVAIVWLGSNDALWSALGGVDIAVTPQADFAYVADLLMQTLASTGAELVVANIPDLTVAPQFFPVPEMLALFGLTCDTPLPPAGATACQVLGVTADDYVPMANFAQVYAILTGSAAGPLSDTEFLSATEVANIQAAIAGYNATLASLAGTYGAVLVDVAHLLSDADTNGYQVGSETLTTGFCGGLFSLDGVHPSNVGHAAVANTFITAINDAFLLHIPPINEVYVRAHESRKNRCVAL